MEKEFAGKKLLVIGAVPLESDIVKHAQAMGAHVAVLDYKEDSLGKKYADEKVLIDALDVDAIVDYCKKEKIDGVTTGFIDLVLPTCYEVCKRLGLPYYVTPKMLSMSTNKIDFKETCMEYDIPVPVTYLVGSEIEESKFSEFVYPVFCKPLDASGSKGAAVCNNREELERQFEVACAFSKTGTAVIEEYITGTEFLLDYIAVDGEFRLLSMFDRYMCDDRESARNYANLSVAPSKALDNYLQNMNERIITMFRDLGFKDGLIFLQGHTNGDKIIFYEMGCRLGGSFYNLEQECIGCNPVDMIVRYAFTGKMVKDIKALDSKVSKFNKYAFSYNCLLGGEDETIAEIKGLEIINKLPSYVNSIQQRFVGSHYQKDGIVDKPLITVYLATADSSVAIRDMKTLNENIEAYNADGRALLMQRINPEQVMSEEYNDN